MKKKTDLEKEIDVYIKSSSKECLAVRNAIKRFQDDIKRSKEDETFPFVLDYSKAEKVIRFAECLKQSKAPYAGMPLKLQSWQKFIYVNLYSWIHKDNPKRKRFRKSYIQVSRKNGKTTLAVPLLLWDLLTIGGAEVYTTATTKEQAKIAFSETKKMVSKNKELKALIGTYRESLIYKDSKIMALSSETESFDGYNPSFALIDEYHASRTDEMISVLQTGQATRENPMLFIITTAGTNLNSPCHLEYKKAKQILNGSIQDETYFTMIFELDDTDKWDDETKYYKANPSINHITTMKEYLKNSLKEVKQKPSLEASYKTKNLNFWVESSMKQWIKSEYWNKAMKPFNENDLLEKDCVAGIDLSKINDFSAFTLCFNINGKYIYKHKFYIPENQIEDKMKSDNVMIRKWIEQGYITATPGNTIDYEYILNDIQEAMEKYNVQGIGYDAYNSNNLINKELEATGLLVPISQSLQSLSEPSKKYEKAILDEAVIDANPVMAWMISCAEIRPDVNGNFKPLKPDSRKSSNRIDGVVSSIMALMMFQIVEANAMEASNTPVFSASAFDFI